MYCFMHPCLYKSHFIVYYSSNQFCTPEHGGTHIDSPIHFYRDRYTTDELLLEKMNGPGVVIDISQQASEDSNYVLSVDDVNDFEAKYGKIPSGAIVMLRTGKYKSALPYLIVV